MEFRNIEKALRKEYKERLKESLKELEEGKEDKTKMDYLKGRFYIRKNIKDIEKIKEKIKEYYTKRLEKDLKLLKVIGEAEDLKKNEKIVIYVDWHKNRVWGYTARARDNKGHKSGIISGCGYDKLSTAVAQVLNQNKQILKELYKIKNKKENINKRNRDILGYGSGYGILPYFEGGVGIGSLKGVLENAGFKVEHYSTKMSDIITISK